MSGIYIPDMKIPATGHVIVIEINCLGDVRINGKPIESKAVSAADVQPIRHGRWIPVDEMEDAFDCSECDAMVSKRLNYCPKCGAKMDKKED